MAYDPFARGSQPVGVRTQQWTDHSRDRTLDVEIWYPGDQSIAGQDLDPATQDAFAPGWAAGDASDVASVQQAAVRDATPVEGVKPLVLLIHGWAGYRREATFLGTHLASHGYLVVSPDVCGSTYEDVDAMLRANESENRAQALTEHQNAIARNRQGDIPFLINMASEHLDADTTAVGVAGPSFGGYSSLVAPAVDRRVAAIAPMCPAGGAGAPIAAPDDKERRQLLLNFTWHHPVPTLFLVADRDSLLPLHSQLDLLRQAPTSRKRMVVLANADHNHFVDDIDTGQEWLREFTGRVATNFPDGPGNWDLVARSVVPNEQLCPGHHAQLAWRGLVTTHMDAHLRQHPDAAALADGPIDTILADRGVTTTTIDPAPDALRARATGQHS